VIWAGCALFKPWLWPALARMFFSIVEPPDAFECVARDRRWAGGGELVK
jgi:hypothetical protein